MSHGASILVVNGLSETTEVLKAVFEPRGHEVRRVRRTQLAEPAVRPGVVVWHDDPESDAETIPLDSSLHDVPRVLIGKARLSDSSRGTQRFAQPFEYGELLQAVEAALEQA